MTVLSSRLLRHSVLPLISSLRDLVDSGNFDAYELALDELSDRALEQEIERLDNGDICNSLIDLEASVKKWSKVNETQPAFLWAHYSDLRSLAEQTATKRSITKMMGIDIALSSSLFIPSCYSRDTLELNDGPLRVLINKQIGVSSILVIEGKYMKSFENGIPHQDFLLPESLIVFGDLEGNYKVVRVSF